MPLPRALRPFATPQYRLLALALTLSLFGTGVWLVAVVWQVIELDGTPIDLSIVATSGGIGIVLAVLLGGVLADRVPQRRTMVTVEAAKAATVGIAAALALTESVELWHLAVVSFVLGAAEGFFYPAYSAWLPALLPADELLAANGIEGVLQPAFMHAVGPAVASAAIAILSPGLGFFLVCLAQSLAVTVFVIMRTTPVRRVADPEKQNPLRVVWIDLRDGVRYMLVTRWLLATLLFTAMVVLVMSGPIEVLLPFAVRDQTGGGAGAFALALAAYGIGGAIGSFAVASFQMPRRYLTVFVSALGVACLPLAVIGFTDQLWIIVTALFAYGFIFSGASVMWGTLLQRRIPPDMIGRVTSLDGFVSLALLPISLALAGPVAEWVGIPIAFLIAGVVPVILAALTLIVARLGPDELSHPLHDALGRELAGPGG